MKRSTVFLSATMMTLAVAAQSVYPHLFDHKMSRPDVVTANVQYIEPGNVRLLPGSRVYENLQRDSVWIMSVGADRLLHSFRTTAGVHAGREGGYMTVRKLGGWESLDCELRGHTTGHILSALAMMYAYTGQECYRHKSDSLLAGLDVVQQAYGNGYLSAFPEELINRNIKGQSVWAPWYTLHKIMAGLLDQYLYAGSVRALGMARGMGDWAYAKLSVLDESTRLKMIRNEFGGINECFYNLYAVTGDRRYLECAEFFYHPEVIDPLKARNGDMGTKHTNTFIPKVLAEMRRYEITGDTASFALGRFFFDEMVAHHTFAPGCLSDKEHYFDPACFPDHVSGYTGETCCTYNMLKLARHLYAIEGDSRLADYYERGLYNHILGQQDPLTGMVSYFLPVATGTHRVYSTPCNSFWCCVGSGFESHGKMAEHIYAKDGGNAFYVNLFIPSTAVWSDNGIEFRQCTSFPESNTTELHVRTVRPVKASVKLRNPGWSDNTVVKVNGKRVKPRAGSDGYITLSRTWRDGDCVKMELDMHLALEYLPGDSACAAVFYGPILLAGSLGTEGMRAPAPHSDPELYNDYYTYDYNIPEHLRSVSINTQGLRHTAPLRWRTDDGIDVMPLYDLHRERHVIYWQLNQ